MTANEHARRADEQNAAVDAKSMRDVGMESRRTSYDDAVERLAAVWPPIAHIPTADEAPPPKWPFDLPAKSRKEAS